MRWQSWLSCFRRPSPPSPRSAPGEGSAREAARGGEAEAGVGGAARPSPARPSPPQAAAVPRAPPAASRSAVSRLPRVRVRPSDLHDETTACCAICLEEHSVNGAATRMPCGHLYHPACLGEWLGQHCTCPVCRFEIGTDDLVFERERVQRNRRHRRFVSIRRTELDELPIKAVRDLLAAAGEDDHDCLERADLVHLAISSDHVNVHEDRTFATKADVDAMSVSSLLALARRANVPTQNRGLEKADLVQALLHSGDLVLLDQADPYRPDAPPEIPRADPAASLSPKSASRRTRRPEQANLPFRRGFLLSSSGF